MKVVLSEEVIQDKAREIAEKEKAKLILYPGGEKNKTREMKQQIEDELFRMGCGRDTTLIVVGGGVTLDLGGFVAATFCRGIPWIAYPTTLLSMVDASIGGKTGVDTPFGKNLIGSFHPPVDIRVDLDFLKSLPLRELRSGFVEMVKHGLIYDRSYYDFLSKNLEDILHLGPSMKEAIDRSVQIKNEIAGEDFKEGGKRRLLNLGHTVGHAIETFTNYQVNHGEAVAQGIVVEALIARERNGLDVKDIIAFFKRLNLPPLSSYDPQALWDIMKTDKKAKNQVPRVTLLKTIGNPDSSKGEYVEEITYPEFKKALSEAEKLWS